MVDAVDTDQRYCRNEAASRRPRTQDRYSYRQCISRDTCRQPRRKGPTMARVALPAATLSIGPGPGASLILPAAEGTSLSTFTGVSFANNGALVLRLVVGASGVGVVTVLFTRGIDGVTPTAATINVANSTTYLLGPWGPSNYNDANGLIQIDKSGTVTGDTAGLYILPGSRV